MATGMYSFCLLAMGLQLVVGHQHQHIHHLNGTYHSKFEDLDLDLILSSRRLVHNYVACLMDTKPCTAEGDELKRILPDALRTNCARCTAKQRTGTKKAIRTLHERYPAEWVALKKKWDLEKLQYALEHEARANL